MIIGFVVLLIVAGIVGYFQEQKQKVLQIDTFEKCADAGYPIMESYPPRCAVPGGKSFTQYIGNELEFSDEILISTPRPNQEITLPFVIKGKARGNWFFEANFSGELFDANKKSLGVVILTATDDWMSEDFVPFEGEMKFAKPDTPTGELIIKNANPSGLYENEKKLIIPVNFRL